MDQHPLSRPGRAGSDSSSEGLIDGTSSSDSMPPPPRPTVAATPLRTSATAPAGIGAGFDATDPDETVGTRLSRSASTTSRTNRLSLTLPIAPPTAFPSRPIPTSSSTVSSFPTTPADLSSATTSQADPADLITAIAVEEQRVLELREELGRAESNLARLKRQWAIHEERKKRTEIRRTQPLPSLVTKTKGTLASSANSPATPLDDILKQSSDLDRRKALLLGQQPGSGDPSTPTQSRRRVFRGGHARALSLLSPTKTSHDEEPFSVHEDNPTESELLRSPASPASGVSAASHDPSSPFYQNLQQLGRYAPIAAAQLSKRASWAPPSGQVSGLKQVAGDLTATLWTFVDDLRQATVGNEPITGGGSAMRNMDSNAHDENAQNTIRASASAAPRPHVSRAFAAEVPTTPTPPSRQSSMLSEPLGRSKETDSNGRLKTSQSVAAAVASKGADAKPRKHFSWTPLESDAYDDSGWSNWDSPTVKSTRWSGSTVNGDASSNPEQADENTTPDTTPQKEKGALSPSSPNATSSNDIDWPAALNRLSAGNIKRTATDLMKEWEKSLAPPANETTADDIQTHIL